MRFNQCIIFMKMTEMFYVKETILYEEKTNLKLKPCFGYIKAILIEIHYVNCFTFMPNYHVI